MPSLLQIIARALRVWWQEVVILLALNAAWFALQIPIITGPPMTATVYAMARRTLDGEFWNLGDAWRAFRQLFWPAWRWALLNLLIWTTGVWNLYAYWRAPGTFWFGMRLLWIAALSVWLAINLLYWPFWLAQEDRSILNTVRNCARFLLLHPGLALALTALSTLLAAVSLITTLPFTLALICWLALIAVIAVQGSLQSQQPPQPSPEAHSSHQ